MTDVRVEIEHEVVFSSLKTLETGDYFILLGDYGQNDGDLYIKVTEEICMNLSQGRCERFPSDTSVIDIDRVYMAAKVDE